MTRVPVQTGWQGGPAHIHVEADEHYLDENPSEPGPCVLLRIEKTIGGDPDAATDVLDNSGSIISVRVIGLETTLCLSIPQAQELAAALDQAIR